MLNSKCNICPRKCNVDRSEKTGICGCTDKLKVNIYQLHYGEEPVISGKNGSGTIFFSGCNLKCVFCQNSNISYLGHGKEYSNEEVSNMMLELQVKNAHNINLVTPAHFTIQLKDTILLAKQKGLNIPVVWNTNAYEETDTLKTIEGLIDIYMPDFKYFNPEMSLKYSGAKDYPEKAKEAIKEMFRQTGHLKLKKGIAYKGLLIRLLVLPHNLNSIELILEWIKDNLGSETFISLMGQYYPTHKANNFKELSRGIYAKEYEFACEQLEKYGFENGFIQDIGSTSGWTPDFTIS
jgi:putative pyruvate formate lyase activating enzyme